MLATRLNSLSGITIKTTNGNLGVSFPSWFSSVGLYSAGSISDMIVNGKHYKSDGFKEGYIAFTRVDEVANGIIEGWYSIYYQDDGNVQHRVTGNFKVKKTF